MRKEQMMKTILKAGAGLAMAGMLACGGGSSDNGNNGGAPPAALKVGYTNPTPASGEWALMKNASSTSSHLVLDLVPPSNAVAGFGVGFTVNAASGLAWSKPGASDTQLIHNTAYALGTGTPLLQGVAKSGDLIAGVYQKGLSTTPVAHSVGAVATIALDAAPSASASSSTTLTVKVSQELQATGMTGITIKVGTVSLQ